MPSYTRKNVRQDLEDLGPVFDGARDLEFRAATSMASAAGGRKLAQ